MPAAKLTHWMVTLIAWLSEPTVRKMKGKKNPFVPAHRFQIPYMPAAGKPQADREYQQVGEHDPDAKHAQRRHGQAEQQDDHRAAFR